MKKNIVLSIFLVLSVLKSQAIDLDASRIAAMCVQGQLDAIRKSSASSIPLNAKAVVSNVTKKQYQVAVTLTNNSSNATTSWSATFNLNSGQSIIASSNGTFSVNNKKVSVTNTKTNGAIPAKGSVTFNMTISKQKGSNAGINNLQATGSSSTPTPTPTPVPPTPTPAGNLIIDGYWESWNSDPLSSVVNMHVDIINISFGQFKTAGTNKYTVYDPDASDATIDQLISLAHAAGKKVKLSIGGASYSIGGQLKTTADAVGMAQATAAYVTAHKIDGVDLDIEDNTAANLQIALFQNIRQLLPNTILTYAPETPSSSAQPYKSVIQGAYQYMDYMSIQAYNNYSGYSYQKDVSALIAMGVPASKIVIGLMPGKDDSGGSTSLAQVTAVAQYIKQNGLRGIMFWSLDRDLDNVTGLGKSAATNAAYSVFHS